MTQPPDQLPPPPPALQFDGQFDPPKLHGGAKVLAIVAIVLGSLGLLGVCGLPQYFVDIGPPNPVMIELRKDHALIQFTVIATIVGIIISIFLLIAGIRCLKLDPRGRVALVYISSFQAAMSVVGMIIGFLYTIPKFESLAQQHPNDLAWKGGAIGAYAGVGIGFISLLFYSFMAWMFTRPAVIAQFPPAKPPASI